MRVHPVRREGNAISLRLMLRLLSKCTFFLFLLFLAVHASAQTITVSGRVLDSAGNGMPDVSVLLKKAGKGTQTDTSGRFTLKAAKGEVLVISSVGYTDKELVISGEDLGGIILSRATSELADVVVVGFGTQRRVNMTGSVGTVTAKQLADRPVRNTAQALQGLVTGLNISQNNGSLETNPSINIRGTGTIGTSSSSPLILVDGMEGSINAINPQDIENISVLKDASASAVYGSRAAFGVILVTTKKGKQGKARLNYNNSLRSSGPLLLPKQMDSYTFALFFNDANLNGGSSAFFSPEQLQRIKDYQAGTNRNSIIPDPNNPNRWADGYGYGNANVDWYKAMYRSNSFAQEHNLSLNGGSDRFSYYLSGNYMHQEGLMRFNTDWYDRYGITAKINGKISEAVSVNYTNRFIFEGYQRPAALTNSFYNDLGRQGWPTLPLYDPNGFLYSAPSPALRMAEGGIDRNQRDWNYQQLQLVLEPVKGWKTFGEFNYRARTDFRHWDVQRTYNHDVNGNAYVYDQNSEVYEYGYKENYYNSNIYSEYSKRYNKHNGKIMAGFQSELTKYRDLSASRQGIIVPDNSTIVTTSGVNNLGVGVPPVVSGQYQNWGVRGFFGRFNYDYEGKYLLEVNARYDGSSRFRSDSRWGLFPSVSVGWNMARESFIQKLSNVIDVLKLRASYGQLGNQNTNNWYPTYVTMPVNTASGNWLINGQRPNYASAPGLVSSTLTWETIKSLNIGVDFSFFGSRLTGSFEVFRRRTLNMVGPAPELPAILGTPVPATNNTNLTTRGFESEITWSDKLKNGLNYSFRFLLSDYQTTVDKYPNKTGALSTYREGQKLNEIWGLTTIGIAKSKEEMDAHLAKLTGGQNALGTQWDAGDVMYADYNNDGKIDKGNSTLSNPGDLKVIGNSTPRYSVGFDASASWKGFDIRAFFQGVLKRDYWQGSYFFWGANNPIWWSTGFVEHTDYFRASTSHPLGQNLNSYYPRPLFSSGKNREVQTRYLQDASYIRLKNIQVGYSLPANLSRRLGIQNLRIYLSGENLITRTRTAKMFDPETIDGGADGSVYPLQKVIAGGVSVTF